MPRCRSKRATAPAGSRLTTSYRRQGHSMTIADPLKLRIDGMDCAACGVKIENALRRLPGVSDIAVNYASGALSLRLDEDRTSRAAIRSKIRSLGYSAADPADAAQRRDAGFARPDLWSQSKTRLVVGTGALLLVAFAVSHLAPA